MTHWVTALLCKPGSKLPETLLLNCCVDREAYGLGHNVRTVSAVPGEEFL